jgi:hypothetical protein
LTTYQRYMDSVQLFFSQMMKSTIFLATQSATPR